MEALLRDYNKHRPEDDQTRVKTINKQNKQIKELKDKLKQTVVKQNNMDQKN